MTERKTEQQVFLNSAVEEIQELSPEMASAKAVLVVIDDQYMKVGPIMDRVRSPHAQPRLSIATTRYASAGEGIAFVKMYLTSQDLADESAEGYAKLPPLIVAMDASLPYRRGIQERSSRDMGFMAAQNIVRFCLDGEGDPESPYPIPYFIGFSTDIDPNERIRKLLEENNVGDKYLGDYWQNSERVFNNLSQFAQES